MRSKRLLENESTENRNRGNGFGFFPEDNEESGRY